jgi:cytochrome c biogenesis protein CcmG, thiol:disulfide interchange protein DsbE
MMNKIFSIGVVLALLIWVSCSSKTQSKTIDDEFSFLDVLHAVEQKVASFEGEEFSFANRESDTVLLDFWAPWCKPCVAEINNILKDRIEIPSNVQLIGVSIDEDEEACKSFLKAKNPSWKQYQVSDGSIVSQLKIDYIPHKILMNFTDSTLVMNFHADSISAL